MAAPYVHRLRVRYSECDQQDVVFNANYFTYFDIALTELWREAVGGYRDMVERDGSDMVVAEATARFLRPAHFDDELDVEVAVAHLGTTSLVTRLEVRRAGELLVAGGMRHVFVDLATRAKTPIPPSVRAGLERFLVDAEPASAERPNPAAAAA